MAPSRSGVRICRGVSHQAQERLGEQSGHGPSWEVPHPPFTFTFVVVKSNADHLAVFAERPRPPVAPTDWVEAEDHGGVIPRRGPNEEGSGDEPHVRL